MRNQPAHSDGSVVWDILGEFGDIVDSPVWFLVVLLVILGAWLVVRFIRTTEVIQ